MIEKNVTQFQLWLDVWNALGAYQDAYASHDETLIERRAIEYLEASRQYHDYIMSHRLPTNRESEMHS